MTNNYLQHRNYHRPEDPSRQMLFDQRRKWIEGGDYVLDVGCGSGWLWEMSEKRDFALHYKGVDLTENFIEGCKIDFPMIQKWNPVEPYTLNQCPKWEIMDAQDLKEKDNSYDIVVLYHILEHCPDWERAAEEAIRVARERVIINFWHGYGNADEKLVLEQKPMGEYDYLTERNSNWICKLEIEAFMEKHGFPKKPAKVVNYLNQRYVYFILNL